MLIRSVRILWLYITTSSRWYRICKSAFSNPWSCWGGQNVDRASVNKMSRANQFPWSRQGFMARRGQSQPKCRWMRQNSHFGFILNSTIGTKLEFWIFCFSLSELLSTARSLQLGIDLSIVRKLHYEFLTLIWEIAPHFKASVFDLRFNGADFE